MGSINFFTEEVSFTLKHKKKTIVWIREVIESHGFEITALNYIFCSDPYLLQLNQEYLNHDTLTDIITFDNSNQPEQLEGDIFISIDRVKENAHLHKKDPEEELHRVMVHGVLHLLGFSDKTTEEKTLMREKEDACLSLRRF